VDNNAGRDHHKDEDNEMNPFWGFPTQRSTRGPVSTGVTAAWWSSEAASRAAWWSLEATMSRAVSQAVASWVASGGSWRWNGKSRRKEIGLPLKVKLTYFTVHATKRVIGLPLEIA
jgi:hypothetical protein